MRAIDDTIDGTRPTVGEQVRRHTPAECSNTTAASEHTTEPLRMNEPVDEPNHDRRTSACAASEHRPVQRSHAAQPYQPIRIDQTGHSGQMARSARGTADAPRCVHSRRERIDLTGRGGVEHDGDEVGGGQWETPGDKQTNKKRSRRKITAEKHECVAGRTNSHFARPCWPHTHCGCDIDCIRYRVDSAQRASRQQRSDVGRIRASSGSGAAQACASGHRPADRPSQHHPVAGPARRGLVGGGLVSWSVWSSGSMQACDGLAGSWTVIGLLVGHQPLMVMGLERNGVGIRSAPAACSSG